MKIEVTKAQLNAIIGLKDDCKEMVGGGDAEPDARWNKYIILIERMLDNNIKGVHNDTNI